MKNYAIGDCLIMQIGDWLATNRYRPECGTVDL